MTVTSVYLSGWEYNRLIGDDPIVPMASALPAQCLWEGAAQFFLFEKVYCTKESYEGELAAAESLGWSTGFIFKRLHEEGILIPVDWQEEVRKYPPLGDSLRICADAIKRTLEQNEVGARAIISNFVKNGADADLEALKAQIIGPMIKHLPSCTYNVFPNSVRYWFEGNRLLYQADVVQQLVEPLVKAKQYINAGISLCRPPGSDVSAEDVAKQKKEDEERQKPLIPALLIGDLLQNDYHQLLKPGIKAYASINQQLWNDFQSNFDKLRSLREIAEKHIWRDLHGEWLPRLRDEIGYHKKFRRLIKRALRSERFDPYLNKAIDLAIQRVGPRAIAFEILGS